MVDWYIYIHILVDVYGKKLVNVGWKKPTIHGFFGKGTFILDEAQVKRRYKDTGKL